MSDNTKVSLSVLDEIIFVAEEDLEIIFLEGIVIKRKQKMNSKLTLGFLK